MKKSILPLCVFFIQIVLFNACTKVNDKPKTNNATEYSSDVVLSWVDLTLKLTKETPGYSPPVAARVYGYTGLALYESIVSAMPAYKTMQGQLIGFNLGTVSSPNENVNYHWGAVANATLYTYLSSCFQTTSLDNIELMNDLNTTNYNQFLNESSKASVDSSIAYGQRVANAMLTYANSDGQSECYKTNFPPSYVVPVGEGLWEPTSSANPIPLQPYWGDVRPFMEKNVANLLPIAPPTYSTNTASDFYKEAIEVYEVVQNLTEEQKIIAEFWSDDPGNTATPPGHSYSIMLQLLTDENADLAFAAEVYAKLGMAIHDAFVSCWNAKYHYNLVRPISYIHDNIDSAWTIPLATPPFPEYTSGHSVQSGATAKVLTDLFGENYAFVDKTHVNRTDIDGSPRSFNSFYEFADEAAISRLYGGIHYRAAIFVGVDQGISVGENIGTLQFK